jgi:hypothetical protein
VNAFIVSLAAVNGLISLAAIHAFIVSLAAVNGLMSLAAIHAFIVSLAAVNGLMSLAAVNAFGSIATRPVLGFRGFSPTIERIDVSSVDTAGPEGRGVGS